MANRPLFAARALTLALGLVLLPGAVAAADDWPQWRGPQRDGQAPGFLAPKVWPKQLKRQWRVEVGEGHASPVVAEGRVFVLARQDDKEVVRALDLADGKQLWSQSYAAPFSMSLYAMSHGKGAKSTPAVADGRLFTLGIGNIFSAWDAQSGRPLWQHDFAKRFTSHSMLYYGTADSPLVTRELAVAYVGGRGDGALVALDPANGKTRWEYTGDGAAYTSPILADIQGTPQIITQSQTACVGISPADGSRLWSIPFTTEYDQNIVTPVVLDDRIIFSGLGKGTFAYRLEKSRGRWSPVEVWHNDEVSMYMSSPVVVGGRLFGLANRRRGQFFLLDGATGKTLWTGEGRIGDNAAIVRAGDVLLALTTGSELLVLKPQDDAVKALARYQVSDTPTWAHPALVGNKILIKDRTSVVAWTVE
jgi:outer membrane protein assembly factor BamB